MVVMKLLVNDKMTACVKEGCLLGVISFKEKILCGETFRFVEKTFAINI